MKKLRILLLPVIGVIELFALIVCSLTALVFPKTGGAMVNFCIGIFPSNDWYSGNH